MASSVQVYNYGITAPSSTVTTVYTVPSGKVARVKMHLTCASNANTVYLFAKWNGNSSDVSALNYNLRTELGSTNEDHPIWSDDNYIWGKSIGLMRPVAISGATDLHFSNVRNTNVVVSGSTTVANFAPLPIMAAGDKLQYVFSASNGSITTPAAKDVAMSFIVIEESV